MIKKKKDLRICPQVLFSVFRIVDLLDMFLSGADEGQHRQYVQRHGHGYDGPDRQVLRQRAGDKLPRSSPAVFSVLNAPLNLPFFSSGTYP